MYILNLNKIGQLYNIKKTWERKKNFHAWVENEGEDDYIKQNCKIGNYERNTDFN